MVPWGQIPNNGSVFFEGLKRHFCIFSAPPHMPSTIVAFLCIGRRPSHTHALGLKGIWLDAILFTANFTTFPNFAAIFLEFGPKPGHAFHFTVFTVFTASPLSKLHSTSYEVL